MNPPKSEMEYKGHLEEIESELKEIKNEIQAYRKRTRDDIKQIFNEVVSEQCITPIVNKRTCEVNQLIDLKLPDECDLKEMCLDEFTEAFEDLYKEFKEEDIQKIKKISNEKKEELNELEEEMPYQNCPECFEMIIDMVDDELGFIKQLYTEEIEEELKYNGEKIEEEIVNDILSPLSNEVRLKILNTLASDSKSFSQLSDIVELEGGNLMFHLNQLREKGFVVQKHKGGEYWITSKGKRVISGLKLISKSCE